jgi:SAM-dependent methyltransferase
MKSKLVISTEKTHLGGNLKSIDKGTYSELVWNYILEKYKIKSLLDVGSGLGFTSQWFADKGLQVTSIEGLTENVVNSKIPTIEHDLTVSPFVKDDIDLVLCIEVVEHIEEVFLSNLLDTLCCGKFLLMTHAIPGQKGYHHVNCQESAYWVYHIEKRGFDLIESDSLEIRKLAKKDGAKWIAQNAMIFRKK